MDAKEYLGTKGIEPGPLVLNVSGNKMTEWMEEYHQAKSKEDAEERYEAALTEITYSGGLDYASISDCNLTGKALRIAAFGKDES